MLGREVPGSDVTGGLLDVDGYGVVAERVSRVFEVSQVDIARMETRSASENLWSAVLFDSAYGVSYRSRQYNITVVDRVRIGTTGLHQPATRVADSLPGSPSEVGQLPRLRGIPRRNGSIGRRRPFRLR